MQLFSSLKKRGMDTRRANCKQTWFDAVDAAEVGAVDADDTAADLIRAAHKTLALLCDLAVLVVLSAVTRPAVAAH